MRKCKRESIDAAMKGKWQPSDSIENDQANSDGASASGGDIFVISAESKGKLIVR